ncbi:hypothetical protein [Suttonella ornithocola]|uniref:Uncharacterized protein n=1 Tax=Suttonella ornithocola TaxID=279832 RepID=A0A380MLM4_9GAMM|nr:hypothetical protein [Suttonella ornithocola]SUO93530.1 Uncharacterised protein [Suttonella ornithocola]
MQRFASEYIAQWWLYKGRKKQEKARRTNNLSLLIEGKRDELAGRIIAYYGYPVRRALKEADETNV